MTFLYPTAFLQKENDQLIEGKRIEVDYEMIPSLKEYKMSIDPIFQMSLKYIKRLNNPSLSKVSYFLN
jgi:hypothetical protein